jgi:hypothetical protein
VAIDHLQGQSEANTTCRAIKEMDPGPSKADFADSVDAPHRCSVFISSAGPGPEQLQFTAMCSEEFVPKPFPVFPRTMRPSTPPEILDLGRRMRRDRGRLERLIHGAL